MMGFRNQAVKTETELKEWWCKHGEVKERDFVLMMTELRPDLRIKIHQRKSIDPTVCDLVMGTAEIEADLKCQRTPFFSAGRYGMDPRYTFTFNSKDLLRYKEIYKNLKIFIWVDWEQTSMMLRGKSLSVDPYCAVYRIDFSDIVHLVDSGKAPLHSYQRRPAATPSSHPLSGHIDSKGNAIASYLIDLRLFKPLINLNDINVAAMQ